MDEEERNEPFDFNATDLEYAMYGPEKRRRHTKEQQTYGVFAEDEDEDDMDRPSFSGRGKRFDFSTPVSFVSGGVKKGNKMEGEDDEDEGKSQRIEEWEEEETIPARPEKRVHSATAQLRYEQKAGANVLAGMRTSGHHGPANDLNLGSGSEWTKKSGKGNVIMQMMHKMGYEPGRGLGANKQGIIEPVTSKLRPGRGAVGAYGREQEGPRFGETAAEAQARIKGENVEGGAVERKPPANRENWKKSAAGKKVKIHYKTLDEVVSEGDADRLAAGFSGVKSGGTLGKIIDMTGPEQKVYDDFSTFSASRGVELQRQQDAVRSNFDVPELMHNLNSLLDLTEEEIRCNDRELRRLRDQSEVLREEKTRLEAAVAEDKGEIERMSEVLEIIQRFDELSSKSTPTLEKCKQLFKRLREEYAVEYQLYGLDALAIPCVLPLLKEHFAEWDPLDPEQSAYGLEVISEWRDVLAAPARSGGVFVSHSMRRADRTSGQSLSAYDQCVWEGWMPVVRRAVLLWRPRENSPAMMNLLEMWHPLLPVWIIENLLEQVIVPKIKEQVDLWDPLVDCLPIDAWLLPWSGVLGDRLLLVYSIIRQKLAKGLRAWMPGDSSALLCLMPWKNAFAPGVMQSFLGMNIVPKIERALHAISLATTKQFMELELFEWMELLGPDIICQMLVKFFFPRLYDSIRSRLSTPGIVLRSVQEYYKGWKDLMPPTLLQMTPIRDEMTQILMAMHQVQQGSPLPPLYHQPPGPAPSHLRPTPLLPTNSGSPSGGPASFRQLVEQRALQRGILFVPQANRQQEGKQVYTFGHNSVYFDGTAIFMLESARKQWKPIGLEALIANCH